ncbi:MAG: 16S rRNA (adenine(1518)-N(6)/adenine(1519)-N(6))-dimethyltransferase RsmA [Dehalococcoidales bacterium]|nr:16S rRNA (adenine(1518)-N(6)/adenine(1519)-N(6))-dimethyltransferase RsmA [Dehalococcoidales bacterium]
MGPINKGKSPTSGSHTLKAESLLVQTKRQLHRFGLKASKGLGQHFLIDEEVLSKIVQAAQLTPADIVLEIGPGLGILTRELVRKAGRVVAVELDTSLAARLKGTLASVDNITIVNNDILKVDPVVLLKEPASRFPPEVKSPVSYKVVANLPYYITSPVLRHFLAASIKPQIMVVMVQKEVAEEIVAKPGRMSVLSISVQFYGEPQIISYVPSQCFYPVPQVDSAILKITPYPQPAVVVDDKEDFFRVVRAGFSASRKQIGNSLAQGLGLSKAEALSVLERAGISSQRRPQTLTIEEWARLWQVSKE